MVTAKPPRWSPAGAVLGLLRLLAEHRETGGSRQGIEHDVVAFGVRGPEAAAAAGLEMVFGDDLIQQRVGVVVEFAGHRLVKDGRVLALELPGQEEELPVDHPPEVLDLRGDGTDAGEGRDGQVTEGNVLRSEERRVGKECRSRW